MELNQAVDAVRSFHKQFLALQYVADALKDVGDLQRVLSELSDRRQKAEEDLAQANIAVQRVKQELQEVQNSIVRKKKEADRIENDARKRANDLIANADTQALARIQEAKLFEDSRANERQLVVDSLDKEIGEKRKQVVELDEQIKDKKAVIASMKELFNNV